MNECAGAEGRKEREARLLSCFKKSSARLDDLEMDEAVLIEREKGTM